MVSLVIDDSARPALSAQRRSLLAQVHVARKQLGMVEDDYRALLSRITGHSSAKDCDDRQLSTVIAEFERLGFRPTATAPRRTPAGSPTARKARAMWISLHQLGAIDDASESGLEAFARRQLGVDRLQWADERQGFRLIEALKAIANRYGWDQRIASRPPVNEPIRLLKDRLVGAQLKRLASHKIDVPAPLTADRADWSNQRLESAASALADLIRTIPKPH